MAKLIAVANQKGGVGKSTMAGNIADAFAEMGEDPFVADLDRQNTLVQWSSMAGEGEGLRFVTGNLSAAGRNVHSELKKFVQSSKFKHVFADCPPSVDDKTPITSMTLMVADLVIIPVSPSPADFWSSAEFVQEIEKARIHNPTLKAAWLLNKTEANRTLSAGILEAIADTGIPAFKTVIPTRECYKQAMAFGTSVLMMTDRGGKAAAKEVRALAKEILEFLES
ncbi:AAA family ATPase [Pandoraea sp. NPDC090278]|uniref:AAA family ATPase n=1 Tax=Pandoraea sp. NPDC090278 TaxID=3364391 RepID=UPI00383BD224